MGPGTDPPSDMIFHLGRLSSSFNALALNVTTLWFLDPDVLGTDNTETVITRRKRFCVTCIYKRAILLNHRDEFPLRQTQRLVKLLN